MSDEEIENQLDEEGSKRFQVFAEHKGILHPEDLPAEERDELMIHYWRQDES
jgi:hypothetical protein